MSKTNKKKFRLDEELVRRGFASAKEKASALVMAGDVIVDGEVVYKSDRTVTEDNLIELKEKFPFASRGALKIEKAFLDFSIDVKNAKALDIGISNGGFTDYMLTCGAMCVTGVDVNIQQVDCRLRGDERVKLIKANARDLPIELIGYIPDIVTIDVSFISVTKILPPLSVFKNAKIISLIKPQFEARRDNVGKGGVIRDVEIQAEVVLDIKHRIEELHFGVTGFTFAGVKGRKGNQEFFFLLEYGKESTVNDTIIANAIEI